MAEYKNELSGVLFLNKEKEDMQGKEGVDTSKWADRKGHCEIEGVKYWISGWLKESSKTGEPFLSLAFKRADAANERGAQSRPTQSKTVATKAADPF